MPTINPLTFKKIFEKNKEILEMMTSDVFKIDKKKVKDNVTCDVYNKKCRYFVWMPDNYVIALWDTKKNKVTVIKF